jgi:hypothetical protein
LGKGKEEDMKTRKLKKLKNKTTTKTKTEFTGHQKKKSTNSKEAANSHNNVPSSQCSQSKTCYQKLLPGCCHDVEHIVSRLES